MSIFPTQYSTLSANALNDYLHKRYSLLNSTCKLLIRNVSDTYVLTAGSSKFIFKVYRDAHRKLEEIKGEVELLNILHRGGACVSYPIAANDGNYLQRFDAAEGVRYGVLFSWADGKVIHSLNEQQLRIVGREMANVHQITSAVQLQHHRKPFTIGTTLDEPILKLEKAFTGLENEYDWLKNTAYVIKANMANYKPPLFSFGYCHFDYFPKNFHFTEDNKITFFDFDFAGEGLLAYDITSFFIHYFLEVTHGKISADEARRSFQLFLEGYREIRPIAEQEIKAIPDLGFAFWLFYLGFQFENYDDWSNLFFNEKFIRDRVALIKKWIETAESLLP